MPTAAQLAAVKEFPEIAQSSSLVDAMVAIDAHFDCLKLAQKAGWKTPPGHADISPAHEATMLWEQLREIARTEDASRRTADFRLKLAEAEQHADALRQMLKETATSPATDVAFKQLGQACAACHGKYRNE